MCPRLLGNLKPAIAGPAPLVVNSLIAAAGACLIANMRLPARPVPAPPFASLASASRAQILTYARSLVFDTSYHASDTRRLTVRRDDGLRAGPLVTIVPEVGVTSLSLSEMSTGRIVARLTSDGAFPEKGLAKGDNFVWVDKRDGQLRALIIPSNPSAPVAEFGFRVNHVNMPQVLTLARLRWDEELGTDVVWIPCDQAAAGSARRNHPANSTAKNPAHRFLFGQIR